MSNTIKNGKGPEIRKGANLRAYWDAEIWDKIGPNKTTKFVQIVSERSELDESITPAQSDVHGE